MLQKEVLNNIKTNSFVQSQSLQHSKCNVYVKAKHTNLLVYVKLQSLKMFLLWTGCMNIESAKQEFLFC